MPVSFINSLETPSQQAPRWTRDRCQLLQTAGVFTRERMELIEGQLISKSGQSIEYLNALMATLVWSLKVFGQQVVAYAVPAYFGTDENAPTPDVIALNREGIRFPQTDDVLLRAKANQFSSVMSYNNEEQVSPLAAPQALFSAQQMIQPQSQAAC